MKGRLMNINDKGKRVSPVADETMELYIEDAIELGADEEDFLNPLREVSYGHLKLKVMTI